MGGFGKRRWSKGLLTMEFVAYKENLDSFLVEVICLLAIRQCNTVSLVGYTSVISAPSSISALDQVSLHPIKASRHG